MRLFMIRHALLFSGFFLLTSCSLFSPVKVDQQNTYVINTVPNISPVNHPHLATLLVMPPETNPVYNTPNMAYTNKPYQIAYFSQNRWAEPPGQMLQPLMVQTLQNTRYFQAVVTPPFVGRYDYSLTTQIMQLQFDFTHAPALVRMNVRAQLSRVVTNELIGTKQFIIVEPICMKTPYGGVIAANKAAARLNRGIATFVLAKITKSS